MCRDDNGNLRHIGMKQVETINDPAMAKCLALRWAMDLVVIWGIKKMVLESDCRRAVDECLNHFPSSPLFELLRDVLDLASSIEAFSIVFCPRSCNKVADKLAKCFCNSVMTLWSDSFPRDIVSLAQSDVFPSF